MNQESIFKQEVKRDLATLKRLHGKKRIRFIWDYFRYKILAFIAIIIVITIAAKLLYQGQRPYRLRVCAVLNNELHCDEWFNPFFEELEKDGKKGACELNMDQPFDYNNKYYYVMELEVMTTISSGRMDVAICGPDMYEYLLSLNACMPLDQALSKDHYQALESKHMLMQATAGLKYKEDGTLDYTDAQEGIFAIDISDTDFGKKYNEEQELEDGQEKKALYAIIISNTDHKEDALKLIEEIIK